MIIRDRRDPHITSNDSRVDVEEMLERHTPPDEMSGEGVPLIVQDSGFDKTHPRLQDYVKDVEFHDFTGVGEGDDVGHGTMVADMAMRYSKFPDLYVNRVFGEQGSGSFEPFRESFEWILDNADRLSPAVLNMSWGTRRKVQRIDDYVNRIAQKGIIPVAASGNDPNTVGSPATAKYAISVGALQEMGKKMTNFSSWDQDDDADPGWEGVPEVSAIGKNVIGARAKGTSMGNPIDDLNTVASGTSFSAPFTSGSVVDLVRRFGLSAFKALLRLEQSADDIPGTHRDGLGRVNWHDAIKVDPEPPDPAIDAQVWQIDIPGLEGNYIKLEEDVVPEGGYKVKTSDIEDAFSL